MGKKTKRGSDGGGHFGQRDDLDLDAIVRRAQPSSAHKSTASNMSMMKSQILLRQVSHLDAKVFSGHLMDAITDEVALEGLDGITIQALKVRLENRPSFNLEGFEDIASSIWSQMKFCKYFRFYILPKPRPDLMLYCWDAYRDERGNAYEPLHAPEEIYLYYPIDDKAQGIRGSCIHYETRKDVTHIAKSCSYTDMIQLFGNRLVIVASQHIREKALLGLNYKKYNNLTIVQYCIMERVGRARYYGEITRGKISSACMNIPPKTLFYMRKLLIKYELVKRQSVSVKFANCRCPAGVTVFHLPRFYKRIESMSSLNTRTVFSWLNNSEKKSVPVERVVSKYGKHTMRALTTSFPTLLETAWEQIVLDTADEGDADGNGSKKKPKTKTIRVLRLKHTDINLQNQLIAKVIDKLTVDDGDTTETTTDVPDDREDQINIESASSYSDVQVLRPAHQYLTSTENYRLYVNLMRSGIGGLTLHDIASIMSLTPLESRSAGRFLSRHNACKEGMVKISKQKAFTYILKIFARDDLEIHLAMQEKFMLAMMELEKIRNEIQRRECIRVEKQLKKNNKRKRAIRKKKAAVITECSQQQSNECITQALEAEQVKETGPGLSPSKKLSPKRGNTSRMSSTVNRPAFHETNLLSEEASEKDTISDMRSDKVPSESRDRSPPPRPSLCLVDTKVLPSKEADDNGPSPKSYLVAVISTGVPPTRSSKTPSPECQQAEETDPTGDAPAEEVFTEGYLDETLVTQLPTEYDEESSVDGEDIVDRKELARRNRLGDTIDREIRKRMIRQRVDWKESEDQFILLGFIASSLFISKYNYARVFLFNSSQVRDLMQKKTGGKSNKTSAAIRRRVHFLLNQQPRFEEYIGMAGAALRDDYLYENFIKKYLRPPQIKIYFNPPIDALETVIDYLHEKFSGEEYPPTDMRRGGLTGIDTLLFLRQLKRTEFYWKATMFAIFCPMGWTSESRANFYRKWRTFKKEIKKNNMSNENSDEEEVEIGHLSRLHASASTFEVVGEDYEGKTPQDMHLEYCFKFLKFFTKHCSIMFKNLLIFGSLNLKGFQIVSFDMSTAHSNISSCVRECTSDTEVRLWTARSLVLDFIFSGDSLKLSEKSTLDKCKKYPLEKAARSLTRARVLIHSKRTSLLCVSRHNLRYFVSGLPSYSYDEMLDFLKYLDEASNVDSLACISVGILHGIVELTDYWKTSITVTESIFTLNEDLVALYDGISETSERELKKSSSKKKEAQNFGSKAKSASSNSKAKQKRRRSSNKGSTSGSKGTKRRKPTAEIDEEEIDGIIDDECFEDLEGEVLSAPEPPPEGVRVGLEEGESYISSSNANALRLLRIRLNQAGASSKQFSGYVEKDFFTLNLPNLEYVFPSRTSLNHKLAGNSHPFSVDTLKELRKGLVELVYHRIPPTSGSFKVPNMQKYLGKYTVLFDIINLAGVVGVSGAYLDAIFERRGLLKGLKYLIESKLVFSVGVAHRRFVTFNNVNEWIIPIRPQISTGTVGHVIMRPWLTSIGGLSWITISRLFTSLLGQLQKPDIPFDELCQVFAPTLSPVEATILIEVLGHLKYLTIYRLKTAKVGLWSKPSSPTASDIEYNADTLVSTKDVYVAISPYVTFLHSQLSQAIQKAYKKQSMSNN